MAAETVNSAEGGGLFGQIWNLAGAGLNIYGQVELEKARQQTAQKTARAAENLAMTASKEESDRNRLIAYSVVAVVLGIAFMWSNRKRA